MRVDGVNFTAPFKIFGVGLSRTGTRSLTFALETLGWRTVHFIHDTDSIESLRGGDLNIDILNHADAFTDTTLVPYVPWLAKRFPDAKFILTTREIDAWLKSVERLFTHEEGQQHEPAPRFVNTAVYGMERFNREHFAQVAKFHERRIRMLLESEPERLLSVDITAHPEWHELCAFLDRPIPKAPFPHANSYADGAAEAFR